MYECTLTSNISAGGSLPAKGEARCNTPETPRKNSVSTRMCTPFARTFESVGEVARNDVVDSDDLHAVSSRLRGERFLDSGDFGGANGSEGRCKLGSIRGTYEATKATHPRTR